MLLESYNGERDNFVFKKTLLHFSIEVTCSEVRGRPPPANPNPIRGSRPPRPGVCLQHLLGWLVAGMLGMP